MGLTFLGMLLVMENQLKLETTPIIKQLHDTKIRTIMVTGKWMLPLDKSIDTLRMLG